MKKIVFFSLIVLGSMTMTSCTADEIIPTVENTVADDTGGQNGNIPPPPPPTGTGGRMHQKK